MKQLNDLKILVWACLMWFPLQGHGQSYPNTGSVPSVNQNYIQERLFRIPVKESALSTVRTIHQENQRIVYTDGLGRVVQEVALKASPDFRDVVQILEYDPFGRQVMDYLPYAEQSGNNGSFKTGAKASQLAYYGSGSWDSHVVVTGHPYSVRVPDNSPLDRTFEQGSPGTVWQPSSSRTSSTGRTDVTAYSVNVYAEVRSWLKTSAGASGTAYYGAGTLYKLTHKDANWVSGQAGTVETFTDFQGRTVLVRAWKTGSESLDTYYVYDDFGDLRYVLPPGYTATSVSEGNADFDALVYAYRYDERRRMAERKLPGAGWEYFVYNRDGMEILHQDAVQRVKSPQHWTFTKYDAHGRIVQRGLHQANYSGQAAAQTAADAVGSQWETRTGLAYGNVSFPTTALTTLETRYYDDYGFAGASDTDMAAVGVTPSTKVSELLTGMLVSRTDGTQPLLSVYYYDTRDRLIQQVSRNHLGGTDRHTHGYDFTGQLLSTTHQHRSSPSGTLTTLLTTYSYDHQGRLLDTRRKVNTQTEILESRLAYNGIGQLRQKQLHSTNSGSSFAGTTAYTYNERGWLLTSTSPQFSQELRYQLPGTGGTAQYNGNISRQLWGHSSSMPNTFTYSYDALDRLTAGSSTGTVMSETMAYDDRGNITSLTRDAGSAITYTYANSGKSNRLSSLSGGLTGSYTYDNNGNALTDRNGLTYTYNHLNLPATATKSGTSVSYTYDALGIKQRSVGAQSPSQTKDYIAGIEYTAGVLDRIQTGEGYITLSGSTPTYHYYLSDHLGNVRSVLTPSGSSFTAIQQQDYYPFGLNKPLAGAAQNRYLYNGKEIQGELGGQYDYGARFYDPMIGRWNVVDPMAEQMRRWSPYAYGFNNPIMFIDPDGMMPENPEQEDPWSKWRTILSDVFGINWPGISSNEPSTDREVLAEQSDNRRAAQRVGQDIGKLYSAQKDVMTTLVPGADFAYAGFEELMGTGSWEENITPWSFAGAVPFVRAAKTVGSGAHYSVAFEMKLASSSYPGVYRGAHFLEANKALSTTMAADARFASSMSQLGINIPRSPAGSILGKSPANWVWHHNVEAGVMQLVPKSQHTIGSSFWNTLHPGGRGGFSIWGK